MPAARNNIDPPPCFLQMTDFPASHAGLLTAPLTAVLTTLDKDGRPQSTAVWYGFEDGVLRVSVTAERQKFRNLRRNPACSFIVVDPADPMRTIEVRADAELTADPDYTEVARLGAPYGVSADEVRSWAASAGR